MFFLNFPLDQELTHHVGSSENVSHVGVARSMYDVKRSEGLYLGRKHCDDDS